MTREEAMGDMQYELFVACHLIDREAAIPVKKLANWITALREPVKEVPLPDGEAIAMLRQITANADVSDDALIYAGSATWEDWRNHVPVAVRMVWKDLSEETRRAVWSTCFAVTGWQSPSPPPPASEPLSRSRLKREAVQRGEELPSFAPAEASEPTAVEQPICICCNGAKFVDPGDGGPLAIPCGRCNGTGLEPRRYVMQPTAADAADEIRQHGGPIEPIVQKAIDAATADLRAENEKLKNQQNAWKRDRMTLTKIARLLGWQQTPADELFISRIEGAIASDVAMQATITQFQADLARLTPLALDNLSMFNELRAEIERLQSQLADADTTRKELEARIHRQRTELSTVQGQYETALKDCGHRDLQYMQPFWNWVNESPIAKTICETAKEQGKTVVDVFREWLQSQLTTKGEEVERKLWLWMREGDELGGRRTAAEIAAEARRIVEEGQANESH